MVKTRKAYVCESCGAHSVKWAGQCPECLSWNTLVETTVPQSSATAAAPAAESARLSVVGQEADHRYRSGFGEFDRVLGGGLVPGSVVLIGGDPGVGKSTLLQQVSAIMSGELDVCYASGEESLRQVAQRANRLQASESNMSLVADTSLDRIIALALAEKTDVLVIDSIQTMESSSSPSAPGSVSQLRDCVGKIVQFAKQNEISVFVIGHVTKEGTIAGPRLVEHMVDTVLYFENDPASRYSMIRSVKNRFGASGEMGVFAMTEEGFKEVKNPSAIFLSRDTLSGPGSVVSVAWEGSRPLLVEIQALVADGNSGYAKRLAQGVDQNRLALLLAVLLKHGDTELGADDVFVNVVGGLKINETAVDLPSVMAIVSSFRDRACRERLISFGELGLAGEVRPVRFGAERIAAAGKQGFATAIVPAANVPKKKSGSIDVIGVRSLAEALDAAF
ncbi:MAG: DNA repair protein RadA [Woeseiaceae bacterium]|nr:DNA repair protein RadA [Woeseiaceae bacterium]